MLGGLQGLGNPAGAVEIDPTDAWERGTFKAASPAAGAIDLGGLLRSLEPRPTERLVPPIRLSAVVTRAAATPIQPMGITVVPGQPGPLSGLPWHSGASCGGDAFEAWRGRRQDIHTGWAPQNGWKYFTDFGVKTTRFNKWDMALSLGVPLLMKENKGQFLQCASGAFDSYHRQFAQSLLNNGLGDTMIRLGWEANGDWFPWSIGTQVAAYKSCFRRIANVYKGVSADFRIEWVMSKKGKVHPSTGNYPGDDVVDRIGAHFYDRFPTHTTQEVWDRQENAYFKPTTYGTGSPWGIQSWYNFTRSRDKFFVASEWGINDGYQPDGFDNPLHIRNMYAWFKKNAGGVAYETYFNCNHTNNTYTIYPTQYNPAASSAYLQLWKAGQ